MLDNLVFKRVKADNLDELIKAESGDEVTIYCDTG